MDCCKSLKEETSLVLCVALAPQEVSEVLGLERLEDLRDGGVKAPLVDGPRVGADALHDRVRRLGGEEDWSQLYKDWSSRKTGCLLLSKRKGLPEVLFS